MIRFSLILIMGLCFLVSCNYPKNQTGKPVLVDYQQGMDDLTEVYEYSKQTVFDCLDSLKKAGGVSGAGIIKLNKFESKMALSIDSVIINSGNYPIIEVEVFASGKNNFFEKVSMLSKENLIDANKGYLLSFKVMEFKKEHSEEFTFEVQKMKLKPLS